VKTRILLIAAVVSPVLTLQAIVDTNQNGLSDLWEKQHNDDELFPETFDPDADPDADGWTNAQEAAAGTDPFSTVHPDGYLQPETTHIPATWGDIDNDNIPDLLTPAVIQVSWPTIPGKQYTLQSNPDLAPDNWLTVDVPFVGVGTEVTYNFVISSSSKNFWQVIVRDVDSDNDTLTDSEEIQIGTNAQLSDSDSDGIDDASEIIHKTNPTNSNSDGDSLVDGLDADPQDNLVDWERVDESNYMLIEVETPSSNNYPYDLNNQGEVLFGDGYWSGGIWSPLNKVEETGLADIKQFIGDTEEYEYQTHSSLWKHFGPPGTALGEAMLQLHGHQNDAPMPFVAILKSPSQPFTAASTLGWPETPNKLVYRTYSPLGIDSGGEVVVQKTIVSPTATSSLEVLNSNLGASRSLTMGSNHRVYEGDVSDAGWVFAQLDTNPSNIANSYELATWDPDGVPMVFPANTASGFHINPQLAELPNGKIVIAANNTSNGKVFISMTDNQLAVIDNLSSKQVALFSGDGTALTADYKIWRNGKLIPIREVCPRFGDLVDDGWSLSVLKSNKYGVYMMYGTKEGYSPKTFLLAPYEFEFIKPDSLDFSSPQPRKDVYLKTETLRFRLKMKGVKVPDWLGMIAMNLFEFEFSVPTVSPSVVKIAGPGQYCSLVSGENFTEVRIEISSLQAIQLGLTQNENGHDEVEEWAAVDVAQDFPSSYVDSGVFISKAEEQFYISRGYSTDSGQVNLKASPPRLETSKSYLRAGGAARIQAKLKGTDIEAESLVQNQADALYYSGHGVSRGDLDGRAFFLNNPEPTSLADLVGQWNGDLDLIIISGCAICNINNWVANPIYFPPTFGPGVGYFPGIDLENVMGSGFAVGYASAGPSDRSGTDRIVSEFMDKKNQIGVFAAWRAANASNLAWNASAIMKGVKYGYFKKTSFMGFNIHEWTEVPKSAW
jgi:hypothetical protein